VVIKITAEQSRVHRSARPVSVCILPSESYTIILHTGNSLAAVAAAADDDAMAGAAAGAAGEDTVGLGNGGRGGLDEAAGCVGDTGEHRSP